VAFATRAVLDPEVIGEAVARALREDLGDGDVTTAATAPAEASARAAIIQKAPGVVFGFEVVEATFRALDPDVAVQPLAAEGRWRQGGAVLRLEGAARAILTGERTALNFLGRLSGIATLTARFVRQVRGSGAVVLDTRKTTPGLRALEKAAVASGGGTNHRWGLYDAVLIKENHAVVAGGVGQAVRRAREYAAGRPDLPLEVECRTVREVDEALVAGATRILLDNFSVSDLEKAVTHVAGRAELEASGGVTLETVREIAATGVDFVSVGALTHSAPALDFSLILEPLER
jgi:nicotinate-nucleotide pyrophosphorylase (carboxylating)